MRCVCLGHFLWMPCNLTSQSEQTSCRLEGWHVCPRFSSIAWYPALGTSSTCSRAVHRVLIFPRLEPVPRFPALAINRPRSIYQYSNMTPRLSGQTSIFGVVFFVCKSLLGIEGQRKFEKFAILTRKPRSHARISNISNVAYYICFTPI